MKLFSDICNSIITVLKLDASNVGIQSSVKSWVNSSYQDFQNRYQWDWRLREGELKMIEFYETGTVTFTNGSRTVTGVDTVWTSAMVDRFIRVSGEPDYYRIVSVTSNTQLIIDTSFVDTTIAGTKYEIQKKFYPLHPDVKEIRDLFVYGSGVKVIAGDFYSSMFATGFPRRYRKTENQLVKTTVTLSTVSSTRNSNVVTGSGTTFIADVQPGDKFYFTEVDKTKEFAVLKVISDTSLYLVQAVPETQSGITAYVVREGQMQIEFDFNTNEDSVFHYRYYKKSYNMLNDQDEPEMPEEYRDVLFYGGVVFAMQNLLRDTKTVGVESGSKSLYEKRIQEIYKAELNKSDEPAYFFMTGVRE